MKKSLIILSLLFSSVAFSQETTDNSFVYEETSNNLDDTFPGNPGDPQTAPIDEYVPVLILVAFGIIFAYSRKNKTKNC